MAWMSSPRPGAVTSTRTSATSATSISLWPVPTRLDQDHVLAGGVERIDDAHGRRREAAQVPRLASERMKTPSSSSVAVMRMRSPRMAPPRHRARGSTAMMPTLCPRRAHVAREGIDEVDLPAPGGPVKPTTTGVPRWGCIACSRRGASGEKPLELGDGARDGAPLACAHAPRLPLWRDGRLRLLRRGRKSFQRPRVPQTRPGSHFVSSSPWG